jgi:hypothetical protein
MAKGFVAALVQLRGNDKGKGVMVGAGWRESSIASLFNIATQANCWWLPGCRLPARTPATAAIAEIQNPPLLYGADLAKAKFPLVN